MAKGNLFQGMARGKVGDVVFSRLDGQQISRVRNRKPANPRTSAQLYQRAVMATTMAAYSAGREIFDHSFQGKKVGIGNQRRFMSANAIALRNALIYDLGYKPTGHINAVVNAPKTNTPVPNQYIVSEGTLDQNLFVISDANARMTTTMVTSRVLSSTESDQSVAAWAKKLGLVVGDIFTLVGFTIDKSKTIFAVDGGIGSGAFQENSRFFFVRMIVTDAILGEANWDTLTYGDIFEVETSEGIRTVNFLSKSLQNEGTEAPQMISFMNIDEEIASFGIIRSRVDEDLRSNESLHWAQWSNVYGIDWQNLLAAWEKSVDKLGGSDLILEGGGQEQSSVTPSLPYAELDVEGNYLVGTDGVGGKAIATYNGQAITATGGNLVLNVDPTAQTATPKNVGTYVGALAKVPASFKFIRKEDAPGSAWSAVVEITLGSSKFQATSSNTATDDGSAKDMTFDVYAFMLQ